jgi:hypothetical protein
MRHLSGLLGMDTFPMLHHLSVAGNRGLGDDGVAVLVEGLLAAPCTRLAELSLRRCEMGDQGLAALAQVVNAGHFERLKEIDLSYNFAVTDKGVCVLARAIDAAAGERGRLLLLLPMLSQVKACELHQVTNVGVGALALALIKKCPRLTEVDLSYRGNEAAAMVAEMVRAAGCQYRPKITV